MLEQDLITPAEYRERGRRRLPPRNEITPAAQGSAGQPYFTTWVDAAAASTATADGNVFGGGLKIRTTLDLELQKAAEQAIHGRLAGVGPDARRWSRSTTRPARSGRWSAAPTSSSARSTSPPRATASPARRSSRSPWSPRSRRASAPARRSSPRRETSTGPREQASWSHNYEDRYAGVDLAGRRDDRVGQLGLRRGRLQQRRARTRSRGVAQRMGIRTPSRATPRWCSAACKEGVTPLEMAQAYCDARQRRRAGQRASLGRLRRRARSRSRRSSDPTAIERRERRRAASAWCPRASRRPATRSWPASSPAAPARRAQIGEFAAGKTGTTENYGDAWFVGFNDELTVAVWVGLPGQAQADGDRVPRRARSPAAPSRPRSGTTS